MSACCSREFVVVGLYLFANVISVVGIVAFNKMLYEEPYKFRFPSSLIAFHFFCTWLFVFLVGKTGLFHSKRIETSNYVKLGAAQTGSVGFVNLSLLYNSVGMYQLLKFSNVLVLCVLEYFWKRKTYSFPIYVCLFCLVAGITVCSVHNVELRSIGLLHGILGSLCTAVYQIYNKSIQTNSEVSALQLLEFEQPFTFMFAFIFALLTENVLGLFTYTYSIGSIVLIAATGVFAFGVNLTCYLIIGKTSPVTYSVAGHVKTVSVLVFGFFVMGEKMSSKSFAGLMVAFFSIVGYTHLTTSAASAAKKHELQAEVEDVVSSNPEVEVIKQEEAPL